MPWRSASASLPVAIWNSPRLADQRRHRVRRRAVHADLAVPVERHEPPRRVDERVDDGEVEAVALGDRRPVVDARPAERVGADVHAGGADRRRGRRRSAGRRRTCRGSRTARPPARAVANGTRRDAGQAGGEQLVGAPGDPAGGVGVGRAAVGRVVLEPAVGGRVVRRRDDDAVGEPGAGRPAAVGAQDGVRHGRRRRVAVGGVDEHGDVVGGEHLERARPRRLGQGVGVAAEEQRAVDALRAAGTRRSPASWRRCGPR